MPQQTGEDTRGEVSSQTDGQHSYGLQGVGRDDCRLRFLSNDKVDWRDIMAPHWTQTQRRMDAHPVVVCLQDQTELDFNGQEIADLGPLSYEAQRDQGLLPVGEKKSFESPARLNEVLRLIATLGGFLARKGDGEPGVKTIWLGLQRVCLSCA